MNVQETFDWIDGQIGFRLITPTNLMEENKKLQQAVKNGTVYHPVFQYAKDDKIDFDGMRKRLEELQFEETVIGELYKKLRDEKLKELNMYRAVGDAKAFTKASKELYGVPEEAMREECLRILQMESEPEEAIYDANDLKAKFEEMFELYHLDSWEIIVRENMGSKVMVGNGKVAINSNYRFSENDLKRLCAHEISTHALRYENGKRRGTMIFADGTCGCMQTEEGLAIYNEELVNALNLDTLKIYAARYLCALNMKEMSLYELVMSIKDYVGVMQAIYIASRLKVGLTDTKLGGGFNKDYIYLQGYYGVKKAVEQDVSVYQKLYYGRIAVEDIPLLDASIQKEMNGRRVILPIL